MISMPGDDSAKRVGDDVVQPVRPKRRIGGGPLVAVALILLPILYVLGVGPATWLFSRGYFGHALESLYSP